MLHNPEVLGTPMVENLDIPEGLWNVDDAGHILHEDIVLVTLVRDGQVMQDVVRGDPGGGPGARNIHIGLERNPKEGEEAQQVRHWQIIIMFNINQRIIFSKLKLKVNKPM